MSFTIRYLVFLSMLFMPGMILAQSSLDRARSSHLTGLKRNLSTVDEADTRGSIRFMRIGGLDEANLYSIALDVARNGSLVVGMSLDPRFSSAFQWRPRLGMIGLQESFDQALSISRATAVSRDGKVVVGETRGVSLSPIPYQLPSIDNPRAAVWEEGVLSLLPQLPTDSHSYYAEAVDALGNKVVGRAYNTTSATNRAILWDRTMGSVTQLPELPNSDDDSYAHDISDDGRVIVGRNGGMAVAWINEQVTNLGALAGDESFSSAFGVDPSGSAIVGSGAGGQALRWSVVPGSQYQRFQTQVLPNLEDYDVWSSRAEAASLNGDVVAGVTEAFGTDAPQEFDNFCSNSLSYLYDLEISGGYFGRDFAQIMIQYCNYVLSGHPNSSEDWRAASGIIAMCGSASSYLEDAPPYIRDEIFAECQSLLDEPAIIRRSGKRATLWVKGKAIELEALLADYGIELNGFELRKANAISKNGRIVVGEGYDPETKSFEGYVIRLPHTF